MKYFALLFFALVFNNDMHSQVGSLQWQHPRGGNSYDYSREIDPTMDGGSVAAGYSESIDGDLSFNNGGGDCWLLRSDATGAMAWNKTYGGSGFDFGYSVRQTADGGFIYAGYTESTDGDVSSNHGGGDCWILKLNSVGAIVWQKTYGGTAADLAQCIRLTADGGYIFCGYTESADADVASNHGGGDCWIVKLNSAGDLQWEKTFGGSDYDYAQEIRQTSDGGYIFTGGTNSNNGDVAVQKGNGDCWLVKLDASGNLIWQSTYGGTDYDFSQSLELGIDGGYVLCGYTQSSDLDVSTSFGNGDCWVIKVSSVGTMEWQKVLGSSESDYGYSISAVSGVYVMTGYAGAADGTVTTHHGSYDCWIVVLDETGCLTGQRSFGGSGVDIGYSIRESSPGSFIVAGYTESVDGDVTGTHAAGDSWVIKVHFSTVGIEEEQNLNENESVLGIYPNPGQGLFHFRKDLEAVELLIIDSEGRTVKQLSVGVDRMVDLRDLSAGVYYVTGSTGEFKAEKIIIQ